MKVYMVAVNGKNRAPAGMYYADIVSARREAYKISKNEGCQVTILGGVKKLTYEGEVSYFRQNGRKNFCSYEYFSNSKKRWMFAEVRSDGTLSGVYAKTLFDLVDNIRRRDRKA